jgi:hypothetical protein
MVIFQSLRTGLILRITQQGGQCPSEGATHLHFHPVLFLTEGICPVGSLFGKRLFLVFMIDCN